MRRYAPLLEGQREPRSGFRRRLGERDDAGMTLTELLVSAILFVTVGTLVSVSLDTFLNVSNQVHSSYANTQQILPVSTSIQRLVRTQVEPGPQYVNSHLSGNPLVPLPPFLVGTCACTTNGTTTLTSAALFTNGAYVAGMLISGTNITPLTYVVSVNSTSSITMSQAATGSGTQNLTFNAETATSATFYANVGVAGQPARVFAGLTTANGTPSPTGTTFTVTDTLADAGSCPLSVSSTATCTFNNNPAKRVASITNVVNSTYATLPATAPTPVFTYTILNAAGSQVPPPANFASCAGIGDLCPADEVQGVEIDLFIKSPGSKSLTPAEDDTIVYRLSSSSYLYSPTVG
jgi:type II secretory pathway pseudopilin PulG